MSHSSGSWKAEIRGSACLDQGSWLGPTSQMQHADFSLCPPMAESRVEGSKLSCDSHKGTNPIHEGFTQWSRLILIISQRPHLLTSSHWEGRLSTYEFWKDTNIQSITASVLPHCCKVTFMGCSAVMVVDPVSLPAQLTLRKVLPTESVGNPARRRGFSSWFWRVSFLLLPHGYHVHVGDMKQHSQGQLCLEFQQHPMGRIPSGSQRHPSGSASSLGLPASWQGVSCFPSDGRAALAQETQRSSLPSTEPQPSWLQWGPDPSLGEGSVFQMCLSLSTLPQPKGILRGSL